MKNNETIKIPSSQNICNLLDWTNNRIGWAKIETGEIFDYENNLIGHVERPKWPGQILCQVFDRENHVIGEVAWELGATVNFPSGDFIIEDQFLRKEGGEYIGIVDPRNGLYGPTFGILISKGYLSKKEFELSSRDHQLKVSQYYQASYDKVIDNVVKSTSEKVLFSSNIALMKEANWKFGYLILTSEKIIIVSFVPSNIKRGIVCDKEMPSGVGPDYPLTKKEESTESITCILVKDINDFNLGDTREIIVPNKTAEAYFRFPILRPIIELVFEKN